MTRKQRIKIRLREILYSIGLRKRHGTLVYLGVHKGQQLGNSFQRFKTCYCFEANPKLFAELKNDFRSYKNVRLFNMAVAKESGVIEFNISSNDGASSSIGSFSDSWNHPEVKMVETIEVQSVNLHEFIQEHNVDYVDEYVSDVQGMDLEVLKTLEPMIRQGRIGSISCEVTKDEHGNIYKDLPDNSESGFNKLLGDQYECVAKGWGSLEDNSFTDVPEDWWEMDCKWRLKQ